MVLLSPFAVPAADQGETFTVVTEPGVEIPVTRYQATGDVLLWLPSEAGLTASEIHIGAQLAAQGHEVWLADLHAGRFLPTVPSSLGKIPASDIAHLIEVVRERSGKSVCLVASGSLTGIVLQALLLPRKQGSVVDGVVLLSPNLYVTTPPPGNEAEYQEVTYKTKLPIVILQPEQSPLRWRLELLQAALEKGGSYVKVALLSGVRDRFHLREDDPPAERALADRLSGLVAQACRDIDQIRMEGRK
jgi:alpha-beta hydrolase superfamily lysophospholipase